MNTLVRKQYQLAILRYCPDLFSGEFANVAVLLFIPENNRIEYRTIKTSKRINNFFYLHDSDYLTDCLEYFKNVALEVRQYMAGTIFSSIDENAPSSIKEVMSKIVPIENVNFLWSDPIFGLSIDPIEDVAYYAHNLLELDDQITKLRKQPLKDKVKDVLRSHLGKGAVKTTNVQTTLGSHQFDVSVENYSNTTLIILPIDFRQLNLSEIHITIFQLSGTIQEIHNRSMLTFHAIVRNFEKIRYNEILQGWNQILANNQIEQIDELNLEPYSRDIASKVLLLP